MKVIFLDVDGVLIHKNYQNKENKHIDETKIELLQKIINETQAKIVLTSNWRETYIEDGKEYEQDEYHILKSLLAKYNITIFDKTPVHKLKLLKNDELWQLEKPIKSRFSPYTTRAGEIFTYLENNKDIESFVIIDDEETEWEYFALEPNLIKTSYYDKGLKEEHITKVIELLNKRNTKRR